MRPLPVELPACVAGIVLVKPSGRFRRNPVEDGVPVHRMQVPVAGRAAREGTGLLRKVEAPDDFDGLVDRMDGTDPGPVREPSVAKERAVPREEDPSLAKRDFDQRLVIGVLEIANVKTEEPKHASESAKMDIGDERRMAERPAGEPDESCHVEAFEDGIDGDAISWSQAMREVDRYAIDEDDIDLDVWYAKGFDRVLDRRCNVECEDEILLPTHLGEEIVQLGVESERRLALCHCPTWLLEATRRTCMFTVPSMTPHHPRTRCSWEARAPIGTMDSRHGEEVARE